MCICKGAQDSTVITKGLLKETERKVYKTIEHIRELSTQLKVLSDSLGDPRPDKDPNGIDEMIVHNMRRISNSTIDVLAPINGVLMALNDKYFHTCEMCENNGSLNQ